MSISAHSPDGSLWFFYAANESPEIGFTKAPRPGLILDTIYESPVFFSTSRTIARQWTVTNLGLVDLKPVPIGEARVEYIEMVTPAGVSWVLALGDDGVMNVELFTALTSRRLVTTVMHKGTLVFVADNRMPIPRGGM